MFGDGRNNMGPSRSIDQKSMLVPPLMKQNTNLLFKASADGRLGVKIDGLMGKKSKHLDRNLLAESQNPADRARNAKFIASEV